MVVVPLTKNQKAIIDAKFAGIISAHTWHFDGRYAATCVTENGKKKKIYMHRLIANFQMVDHINQNRLDNRRSNLRPTDKSKNALNVAKNRGVTFVKSGKRIKRWAARIQGRFIGYFFTETEARQAYLSAKAEVFQ